MIENAAAFLKQEAAAPEAQKGARSVVISKVLGFTRALSPGRLWRRGAMGGSILDLSSCTAPRLPAGRARRERTFETRQIGENKSAKIRLRKIENPTNWFHEKHTRRRGGVPTSKSKNRYNGKGGVKGEGVKDLDAGEGLGLLPGEDVTAEVAWG